MALVVRATTVTRYSGLASFCFCVFAAGAWVWLIAGIAKVPMKLTVARQMDAIFTLNSLFFRYLQRWARPGFITRCSCGQPHFQTGPRSPLLRKVSREVGQVEGQGGRSLCK